MNKRTRIVISIAVFLLIASGAMIFYLSLSAATTFQITADADDGHYTSLFGGNMVTDGATSPIGCTAPAGKGSLQLLDGAYRFQNVTIAQGAQIVSATIAIKVGTSDNGPFSWEGNAADDASAWSSETVRAMATTSALVNINLTASQDKLTTNVTAVVQEIVDRAGWTSGNSMKFGLFDQIGSCSGSNTRGTVFNRESSTDDSAELTITLSGEGTAVLKIKAEALKIKAGILKIK